MALVYSLTQFASWLFSTVIGVALGLETMPIVTGCVTLMWLMLALTADRVKLNGPNVLLAVFYALVTLGIVVVSWAGGSREWALTWTPQALASGVILIIALIQLLRLRRQRKPRQLQAVSR